MNRLSQIDPATSRLAAPKTALCLAAAVLMGLLSTPLQARDLFQFAISVDGNRPVFNSNNDIRDFIELFDDLSLSEIFPDYTVNSEVVALLDVRGIKAIASYARGSSELRLALPQLGLDVRFPGGSREESQELLEEWLKGLKEIADFATSAQLRTLLHATVEYSPVEPVAGNPMSLQSRMTAADYTRATSGPYVSVTDRPGDAGKPDNVFYLAGRYSSGGNSSYNIQAAELQFGGVINLGPPRWAILLDMPTMVSWTEGAESIMTSFGTGLQYRVSDHWNLTAFGRGGIVGSIKVGALAALWSANVTSYAHWDLGQVRLGWGLLLGVNSTIDDIEIDKFNVTYDVTNYPIRTGLDLSGPMGFDLLGLPAGWQVFGNFTHSFGDDLYLQSYWEVGAAFRLSRETPSERFDRTQLSVAYVFGESYDAISAGLGFNF